MKKKITVIAAVIAALLLAVLFVPIPISQQRDGGTREYRALTYKIVKWHRFAGYPQGIYVGTRVHWFADGYKSIDELWEEDRDTLEFVSDREAFANGGANVIYDGSIPEYGVTDAAGGTELTICYPTSDIGVPVLSRKTVAGGTAALLADMLAAGRPSGERSERLSEHTYDDIYEIYQELTGDIWLYMWVEHDGVLYRVKPDGRVCVVDEYLSGGEYLELDGAAKENDLVGQLEAAKLYYPYDYWVGEYKNGTLELRHTYFAQTSVTLTVTDIDVVKDENAVNSITVELTSKTDQTVGVGLSSESGGCIIYTGDSTDALLKASVPQNHTLYFTGNDYVYYLLISVDNTRLYIKIDLGDN